MKYSYFESVKSKACHQMSVADLIEVLKGDVLFEVCETIRVLMERGDEKAASQMKAKLPVIVLGQLYEEGQPRSKNGGQPTGMLMLDYDDCKTEAEASDLMQTIKEKWLSDMLLQDLIVAVHYSPRMHGVHIWYRWIDGCHSYAECNERLAKLLELPNYDASCKDNSRCSFLVPINYFGIQNWDALEHNEPYAELQAKQENESPHTNKKQTQGVAKSQTPSPVVVDTDFPSDYNGVSYDSIIAELTRRCAPASKLTDDGKVMEGARDNTFFKIACYLRYICDNNARWLYALAPDWAMELDKDQEGRVYELCVNACKRSLAFNIPKTLTDVLDTFRLSDQQAELAQQKMAEQEDMNMFAVAEMDEIEESLRKFLIFPKKMPPVFQEFCDGVKPEWKAAVVFTLLPTLGTCMSRVRAKYLDQRLHSASFQTVIEAKMASGKQNYSDIADFVLTPITNMDLEGNTALNMFNAEAVKANGAKTLGNPPDVCVRKMIGKFTEAGLNGVLDTSKGLHIWSGVSEIDEVSGVWKDLSYILRLAYDNAAYGRTLQSQRQFRGERKLYLNTFLCGTPRAVARVYNDPEDGLVSRTMFFKLMVETPGIPLNKVTDRAKQSMLKLIQRVHDKYCITADGQVALEQTIDLSYVNKHLSKWLERKNLEATEYGSEALERFRRRDACNGFRAAIVAHILYTNRGRKMTEADKKVVLDFAEWVAEYSLMMHDYKFGAQLNEIIAEDEPNKSTNKQKVLDKLPQTFTLAEAYRVFRGNTQASIRARLARLVQKGLLVSEERGIFQQK